MSKGAKTLFAVCLVAVAAACAPKQEEVVFIEEPVVAEPTLNKF